MVERVIISLQHLGGILLSFLQASIAQSFRQFAQTLEEQGRRHLWARSSVAPKQIMRISGVGIDTLGVAFPEEVCRRSRIGIG